MCSYNDRVPQKSVIQNRGAFVFVLALSTDGAGCCNNKDGNSAQHKRHAISSRRNCVILFICGRVSGMRVRRLGRAARSEQRAQRWLTRIAPRPLPERRSASASADPTAHTAPRATPLTRRRAHSRTVSTRYSVAKVCAMIYKWEPPSNARVTLIAHGEPVYKTKDIRNSPAVRDGGRATPSGHTRDNVSTHLTLREKRKPIFNVSSQYSLLLLRQIAERLQQELQGYANEFWTLLYQG